MIEDLKANSQSAENKVSSFVLGIMIGLILSFIVINYLINESYKVKSTLKQ